MPVIWPPDWWLPLMQQRGSSMSERSTKARVTARIVRTEADETFREYEAGGVAYGSLDALEAALDAC